MHNFLVDKEFSRKYEKKIAEMYKKKYSYVILCDGKHDDRGVDIYIPEAGLKIDVKCYRKSLKPGAFKGVFIETYLPKSGRPGWYMDDSKETTHYILCIDCDDYDIKYKRAVFISKDVLDMCMCECDNDGRLIYKRTPSGDGFILPYDYLYKWGEII